jgi:hypothetical protein
LRAAGVITGAERIARAADADLEITVLTASPGRRAGDAITSELVSDVRVNSFELKDGLIVRMEVSSASADR